MVRLPRLGVIKDMEDSNQRVIAFGESVRELEEMKNGMLLLISSQTENQKPTQSCQNERKPDDGENLS